MAVIDRDHSALSEGLKAYLGQSQELVELEDKKEVLQEELYYGNIEYVLVIPEGFEAAFTEQTMNDSAETEATSADGSAAADGLLEGTGRPRFHGKLLCKGAGGGLSFRRGPVSEGRIHGGGGGGCHGGAGDHWREGGLC